MATTSILIVACDAYLAGIFGRKFELDGWDVEIAESLEEGERKSAKMRPSIFLLDVDCVSDTEAQVRRLRSLPTLQKTKLVMLASRGDRRHIQAASDAGADDYLLLGHFVPQEAVIKMKKLLES
jgi:DNA-binding response OmpR family regulator